jgi:hypothetical protein
MIGPKSLKFPPDLLALTCHCGNFGQEVGGHPSGSMVNGQSFLDRPRLGGFAAALSRI